MQHDKCVHYNGTVNECCEAGANYRQLAGPGDAFALRLPCHGPEYRLGRGQSLPRAEVVVTCDKRRVPTKEEIEADERESKESMDRLMKIRAAIVAACGGPWKKGMGGSQGTVTCPCCPGLVRYSRAGYNGHIHAHCSTAGCASWME